MTSSNNPNRRAFSFGWLPALFHRSYLELAGVRVHLLRSKPGPHRYFVVHGDETTAREVLTMLMRDHPGIGYVVTSTTRVVHIEGLRIDPNRLWSRVGAERSLRRENRGAGDAQIMLALDYLDHHRPAALRRLIPPPGSRLFALHNNAHGYSMEDELADSDQTSLPQPGLPGDFFLCTDPADFARLKQSPYNVLLQSKPDPDDGSLSRLAARQGFRYINLECQIGDYAGQMERALWLETHLP